MSTAAPIVHIGYHKTATTWLQEELFPLAISHDFVPRLATQQALLVPVGLHFDAATARSVLGLDERTRPVLLSEENLTGYLHNGGLHGFLAPVIASRIGELLPDAHIVIFIRNQLDILRAAYAQYVSGGGTWGQRRYFDTAAQVRGALTRPWKAPVFEYEHFEFDRLIAHYDSLFGRDRVHVYLYESLNDREAKIARLERELGLVFSDHPPPKSRANPSFGGAALAVLRGANLFTRQSVVNKDRIADLPGGQVMRHAVKRALSLVPGATGKAAPLPAGVRARAQMVYPASNHRLLALRDLPLAEHGYPL